MKCNITEIMLDPRERNEHIKRNLYVDGFNTQSIRGYLGAYESQLNKRMSEVSSGEGSEKTEKILRFISGMRQRVDEGKPVEDESSCYCGLPLTKVPKENRERLIRDHLKIKGYIEKAGILTYDPAEAPFNPQQGLVDDPRSIFDIDNLMVISSRLFEFTNIDASTGAGIEEKTAITYNKMPLVLVKKGIFSSRMSTGARRIILLEYDDIDSVGYEFTNFVETLKTFNPGVGTCRTHGNTLIGFEDGTKSPVCLEGLAEEILPGMKYDFDAYLKK